MMAPVSFDIRWRRVRKLAGLTAWRLVDRRMGKERLVHILKEDFVIGVSKFRVKQDVDLVLSI